MRTASPGPGKRLAIHDLPGQAQLETHLAHLILKELSQRLDELESHALREPAHVVMALDERGRDSRKLTRFR